MKNWFETLNDALNAEALIEAWGTTGNFTSIQYGETRCWTWQDGSKYGHIVSIYRDQDGRYERPIHYAR